MNQEQKDFLLRVLEREHSDNEDNLYRYKLQRERIADWGGIETTDIIESLEKEIVLGKQIAEELKK